MRTLPCGAGARYLSVSPEGGLSFCHRFGCDGRYLVGSVETGLDREAVGRLLAAMRRDSAACEECWARFLCGGPCHFDLRATPGDAVGPGAPRCDLRKRILELSMWLFDAIPRGRRAELGEEGR